MRPNVLPHVSKLSKQAHEAASGPEGWNAEQGFYIYRNRRMLVAGDWLGPRFQKEEHYKLARIGVDLPNLSTKTGTSTSRNLARAHPTSYALTSGESQRSRGDAPPK